MKSENDVSVSSETAAPEEMKHCNIHQAYWIPSKSLPLSESSICPWCTRDYYRSELTDIQNTFKLAVLAHESRGVTGAGNINYMGDFVSVAPSVTTQMKRWITRWDVALSKIKGV